jgi:hypothetical protein
VTGKRSAPRRCGVAKVTKATIRVGVVSATEAETSTRFVIGEAVHPTMALVAFEDAVSVFVFIAVPNAIRIRIIGEGVCPVLVFAAISYRVSIGIGVARIRFQGALQLVRQTVRIGVDLCGRFTASSDR